MKCLVILFALIALCACQRQMPIRNVRANMAPVNRTNNLRLRSVAFRRELLQAINGIQAVRDGLGQIQIALLDAQRSGDLPTLIRTYNDIDRAFTSVISNVEEISRGARDGRMSFRRIQFNIRRLIRERANVTVTPRNPRPVRNATRGGRIPNPFNNTIFGIINRISTNDRDDLLRTIQTQTQLSFGEVRLLINPIISMVRITRAATLSGRIFRDMQASELPRRIQNRLNNAGRPVGRPVGRPAGRPDRAVGDDGEFFNEELPAEAFTDDVESAFAEGDEEDALIEEELALDEEVSAAFAEDDADSSDFAILDESGSFDSVEELPSFAIEESGDFAAIEEEAAAFALDENLESAAAVEDENLQFFSDDVVSAAVEDPSAAFSDNEHYLTEESVSLAVDDIVPGDVAVVEEEITTFDDQVSGDFAVADELPAEAVTEETDLAVDELPADFAVGEELPVEAVAEETDLAVSDELPADLAVAEETDFAVAEETDLAVSDESADAAGDEDVSLDENLDVESLDDAAAAEGATPTSLTQPASSTPLPSWGIALIVIGAFVAIACILVVIQLFIYFRSA